jgi:L-amino acid N-acyltransferase YncA
MAVSEMKEVNFMDYKIEKMQDNDWEQVRSIYLEGIATGNATFESEAPSWEKWKSGHLSGCSLVACTDHVILGWAALSPTSSRCVYEGVAEVSVYVSQKSRGQKVGHSLLKSLIELSETVGIWTLQAGIFPENVLSVQLHKKCGFREIGRRERIGKMKGIWRDVILLERRSQTIGIDEEA